MNEPWNAPELIDNTRSLGFEELSQTDIFSLGLICLHLLLPLIVLENAGLCLVRKQTQEDDEWATFVYEVENAKRTKVEQTLSVRLLDVIEKSNVSTQRKDLLRQIVTCTIEPVSGDRMIPWADLLPHIKEYLSQSFEQNPNDPIHPPPLTYSTISLPHSQHNLFDLAPVLGELDDTDYVLRANILQDLEYKAKHSTCADCQHQYSFQITVCRTIGFGSYEDAEALRKWLNKSSRMQQDVDMVVHQIGEIYQITGRVAESVLEALGIGVLVSADRTEEYQVSRRLSDAEKSLRNEIEQRARVFGQGHRCLTKLKSELSLVLKAENRLVEAEKLQQEIVTILTQFYGERHPSPLLAKITLADTLAQQGYFRRAEDIQTQVQPVLKEVLGAEHPETLSALQLLATTLTNLGEYKKAEVIMKDVVSARCKVLNPTHPATVRAELSLVSVLRAQGLLDRALDLMKSVSKKLSKELEGDKLTRAQLYIAQASLYKEMRTLDRATSTMTAALAAIDSLKLPANDRVRLTALQTLATIYGASQEWSKQEFTLRAVLNAIGSPHEKNREWSTTSCLLAKNLLEQNRWDDALDAANETKTSMGDSVTEDPENYIACIDIVATVLSNRGHVEEVEKIWQDLMDSCKAAFGENNSLTLNVAYSLGMFLADRGRHDKAQRLYEEVLGHLRETSQLGKDAIKVGRLLAIAHREQGNFDKAVKQCEEALAWAETTLGESHTESLAIDRVLAVIYAQMGRFVDAERLFARLEEQNQDAYLGIHVKENEAQLREMQGRPEEAGKLRSEAHDLMALMKGKSHPEYIISKGNVLAGSLSQAEALTDDLEREVLENIQSKKKILGAVHPSTIKTMSDLANAYGEHGHLEDAEKLFEEIWELGGPEAIQNPQRYATLLGKRAELYFRTGRLDKAEELERKALAIRQGIFGDDHRTVLVSMANLASTLSAQEKYTEAEEYLRKVVTVRESSPMTELQEIFSLLKSKVALAAVLFFQKKLQESSQLYKEAVEGAEHLGVSTAIVDTWRANLEKVSQCITGAQRVAVEPQNKT